GVAIVIGLYLVFRLFRPTAKLALGPATWLSAPVGFVAGILQGASGVSAPVSVTFLSIIRLDRETFIVTIAVFFVAMGVVQAPTLIAMGLLDWRTSGLSLLAVLPLLAGMPLGEAIIRRVSRQWFDRLIMLVLAVMAVMLVVSTQFPASAATG
ncbi:MAG: TSUP family transporter, partial [Pseudomonadota bacterium]|nr:TSUP family transporter [Pseudomonadota bacterium]